jgi:hypothetical protein
MTSQSPVGTVNFVAPKFIWGNVGTVNFVAPKFIWGNVGRVNFTAAKFIWGKHRDGQFYSRQIYLGET